jgi:hypothetical protein
MKTTLKYNTIESLQYQEAWKTFIDTLVDDCNGLYDDMLSSFESSSSDSMSVFSAFSENDTPKSLGLYEFINSRYILTADKEVKPGKTYYEKTSENVFQPQYPLLDYINTNTPAIIKENISLRGLLHVLSMYGCRIAGIDFSKVALPHTYKKSRDVERVENIYGYDESAGTDYPVQATVDGQSGQNPDGLVGTIDINDDTRYTYTYIRDIYGYNQKHAAISLSPIRKVKEFHYFKKKAQYNPPEGWEVLASIFELMPECYYIEKDSIVMSKFMNFLSTHDFLYGDNPIPPQDVHKYSEFFVTSYCSDDARASGVKRDILLKEVFDEGTLDKSLYYLLIWCFLKDACTYQNGRPSHWIYDSTETSYILNNKQNMIDQTRRIEYNRDDTEHRYHLFLALSSSDKPAQCAFTRIRTLGSMPFEEQVSPDTKSYSTYKDDVFNQEWIVLDEEDNFYNTSLPYLKEQLFAEECTIKAQPLFLYRDNKISMCGNFTDATGGINELTYELERYDKDIIDGTYSTSDNTSGSTNLLPNGVFYGAYYYKWEQFDSSGLYIRDVYTVLNFENVTPGETNPLAYFFDGSRNIYPIDTTAEDYTNNREKNIDGYRYINAFRQEYFETMYFNHFIKIYPIEGETSGNTIKTNKLYCDNLELVEFGNIIPYVVTYERKGEYEENPEAGDMFNDIDCSIFSKILSYNKYTHLVTVDEPIYFEKTTSNESLKPKYAVVAYQNVSPFNRITSMTIVAPDSVKDTVAALLEDYKDDDKYKLNLISETDYHMQ